MYDPLIHTKLNSNQDNVNSYWHSTTSPISSETLKINRQADVVIIGAGYTGLNCAIKLAENGIKNIVVVEANSIGWGCSGRNAGFVLPGSGRLGYKELVNRFGMKQTQNLHQNYMTAIDDVDTFIRNANLDIMQTEFGYLKLAHSKKWFEKLQHTADYLSKEFNYEVEVINKSDFQNQFVDHQKVYGSIRYKNGFGVNPLQLVNAYAKRAMELGVKIYSHSSVNTIESSNNIHRVMTQSGSIKTDKLVVASNGYTPKGLNTPLAGKVLPVLTSVIVTRPLTAEELTAANFLTQQVMMDTRELKYYYRLLPDNRILFGGRGAISGKQADHPKYQLRLLQELHASFPALKKVTVDYSWIGWISVSYDQMPHIYKTNDNVFYATGYCGSGVSFSALAGKQLATLITEQELSTPLMTELPNFPFAPFRRVGQRFFYQYGRIKDALS